MLDLVSYCSANKVLCLCIYIYIYICIYNHPQTDYFVVSQLFSVARHVGRLKLGLKPTQLYVILIIILLSQQAKHICSGIIRHYVVAFFWLHFCLTWYWSAQFILYIYMIFLLIEWEKKVITLKWIGPQVNLLLDYLFFFNMFLTL